jgi:hypothetical protein
MRFTTRTRYPSGDSTAMAELEQASEPEQAPEPEESYLVWGAGFVPPVFVRPIFVRRPA